MSIKIEFHPATADVAVPLTVRLNVSQALAQVRRYRSFVLLLVLAMLWGSTSVTTKVGVTAIPPFTFAFARLAISALFLYAIMRRQGQRFPKLGFYWLHLVVGALLHGSAPYILLAWGLQYVDSAMASVLGGITPLVTILLAHFLHSEDQLTGGKVVGMLIGFAGLFVLVSPALLSDVRVSNGGLLAVGIASVFFGAAYVHTARYLRSGPGLALATAQLMLAALVMLPVVLVFENPLAVAEASAVAIKALLITGVLGTGLPFLLYQYLKDRLSPSQLSLVSYIIPAVGVTLGVLVLGESVTWVLFAGGAIILLGVMVVNGAFDRWVHLLHCKMVAVQMVVVASHTGCT